MAELEKYIKMFEGVRRAPGPMWGAATKGRAPHKPLLLLAVLDLAARGALPAAFLDIGGDLVELNELFNGYWRRVVPAGRTSSIAFPFSRLHNEPFWELVALPGRTIDAAAVNNVSTVVQLRALAAGARMDAELHLLMQGVEARAALRLALIHAHFDATAAAALEEQAAVHAGAAANVPGFLLTLAGRGIIPPADRALWPAQENLGRHRQRFGLD